MQLLFNSAWQLFESNENTDLDTPVGALDDAQFSAVMSKAWDAAHTTVVLENRECAGKAFARMGTCKFSLWE